MKRIVNALDELKWGKRTCAVFVLSATTVIALPAQTLTTLFTFDGTDGAGSSGLVQGRDGNFYGTAAVGGTNPGHGIWGGTVFKISPSGTLTTLHNFCSQTDCADGQSPDNGLVQAANGDFYGTTQYGGASPDGSLSGTVFKITPGGKLTTIYSFCAQSGCADGAAPVAGLIQGSDGNFYGTTYQGGNPSCEYGCGTVFRITPAGALTTLYSFCAEAGCPDGEIPEAGLFEATDGTYYGATYAGGNTQCPRGCGTVFKITSSGTLTTLYTFCSQTGCTDGAHPAAGLVEGTDGNFYGTTWYGGSGNAGTIFKLTPAGALTTLHRFLCQDQCPAGSDPGAPLIQATDGNFYGTSYYGGANGLGTIFRITSSGKLTTLYSFSGDQEFPYGALLQATDGDFYGAAGETIFSMSEGLRPFVKTQPHFGAAGAAITILGTDLTGSTSVTFNGTPAAFTIVSATEITTTVPAGATSGEVQVTTPGGTLASGGPFLVAP